MNQLIDVTNERGEVQVGVQSLRPKRRLETGHEQGRTDSFSGNIPDRDAPSPLRQGEKSVVVTANAVSRLGEGLAGKARNRQTPWRQEHLLNMFRAVKSPAQRSVKSRAR